MAFGLANLLDDDLLGGLRGDTAEIDGWQGIDDEFADLGIGFQRQRVPERDLHRLVLDRIGHLAITPEADLSGRPVDIGADIVFVAVFRTARFLDRLLHGFQHFLAVYALFAGDIVRHLQQFRFDQSQGRFHRHLDLHPSLPFRRGNQFIR